MGARLAAWLFRKMVEKHIIGIIWVGEDTLVPGEIIHPRNAEVLFRGK